MTARSFKCPNCDGAITQFDSETGTGTCPFCGSVVYDPEFPVQPKQVVEVHVFNGPDDAVTAPQDTRNASQPQTAQSAPVPVVPVQRISPKNRNVALILAIFLGWFGIHRFYAGKIGTGIIWLLTVGGLLIGWIIDIVMIANNRFTDSSGAVIVGSGPREVCGSCGAPLSLSVMKCRSCGAPARRWFQTWWGIVAIALVVLILIGLFNGGSS